jgi:hypothetical protein
LIINDFNVHTVEDNLVFRVSEFEKIATDETITYNITFEIECNLYYQNPGLDYDYYGRLTEGVFKTQVVLTKDQSPYPALFEDNTILWREQKTFAANLDMRVSKWSINAKAKAGVRYNMVGYKAEHYFYFGSGGSWKEPVQGSVGYGKLGAKLGASVQHPIIWRFFGELDCEYARMFSGADRN